MARASPKSASPRVWLLCGPRAGEVGQQRALAEGLGEAFLEKAVFVAGAGHKPAFGFTPEFAASFGLVAPWPRLVIAFGKTLPAALWVRAASAGTTRIALLGRPKGVAIDSLDLILPMPQDSLPEARNVLRLRLPLNQPPRPDARALTTARARLAAFPKPWTLLLIGGSTRHYELDAAALAVIVRRVAAGSEGSLLVSTSPRTPKAWLPKLEAALRACGLPYELSVFKAVASRGVYAEYLALADQAVLTADSASMVADCWRSGLPTRVVLLPPSPRLRLRRASRRLLPTALEECLRRRGRLAATVDLDQWLEALAAQGLIGLFGESVPQWPWSATLDDDLQRVLPRLRELLAP